jgi:anti-sigma factor RsiW
MTHLTDEQFEDVLAGAAEPSHLAECGECRARLAERRAVRDRLRASFASVRPSAALADRVRQAAAGPAAVVSIQHKRRMARLGWETLAAAAAVLVAVSIPAILYLTTPREAAAQEELAQIHEHNLMAHNEFYADADPAKIAEYLKTQLGFQPATPRPGQGLAMRGCCVTHFKGQEVGSYVVDTPRGPISIIVVPQNPKALGLTQTVQAGGQEFWTGGFATNNLVVARRGAYSYCAVGEVPHDLLTQVLLDLGLGD